MLNLIALVVCASSLFMRSADPVIPQIAHGLGVEASTAALLSTAFSLPYALIQPVLGAVADMMSKVRLMLLCLLIVTTASIVSGLSSSFEMLMATRVLAGVAAGGVVPIAFALVGDKVPVAQRQVAMGRILFAIMIGNLLGATVAGVVGDLVDWRGVFLVTGGFGLLVLAVTLPGVRSFTETRGHADLSVLIPNYRTILSNPLAKFCFGAVFFEALFMYGAFPYVATLLHQAGETRASIAGVVIGAFGSGGALYGVFVSKVLPRLGEIRMMRLGGMTMGFCLIIIAANLPWPLEFANFLLLGFGFYMLHAVIQIYASELAPAARGSAMALHSFFFFLGQAVGPIVYGLGLRTIGIAPVLLLGAGVLAAVGMVCSRKLRRHST
jgi:predicted MFS family arabinose efflux permease